MLSFSLVRKFFTLLLFQTGILNALPPITSFVTSNVFGVLSDFVNNRQLLSKSISIKTFEGISSIMSSICCMSLAFSTSNWKVSVTILCSVLGFGAAFVAGRYRVPYEVTPDLAGLTFGFVHMVGQSSGFVAPLITSALTGHDVHDPSGWRNLFLTASGILLGPYLIFVTFAKFDPLS